MKRNNESGNFLAIGAMLALALLLLMFGSWQFSYGAAQSIKLYFVLTQTLQQMRLGTPSKQGALDAGAWVARLNGIKNIQGIDTPQESDNWSLKMSYLDATVPHTVQAQYKADLTLLGGLFSGTGPGLGLIPLSTSAQMSATSYRSFVAIHADISRSIAEAIQPDPLNPNPSIISELLDNSNIPTYPSSDKNSNYCCWPINVGDTKDDDDGDGDINDGDCSRDEKERCYGLRKFMVGYYGSTARPIWIRYDRDRPGPPFGDTNTSNPSALKWGTYPPDLEAWNIVPPDLDSDPTTPISAMPEVKLSDSTKPLGSIQENITYGNGRQTELGNPFPVKWEYYNPGYDYDTKYEPPGENLFVCGNPFVGALKGPFNICHPWLPSQGIAQSDCFPLQQYPGSPVSQFIMNPPGYRLYDYDVTRPECARDDGGGMTPCPPMQEAGVYDPITNITDGRCVTPWITNSNWLTTDEIAVCGGVATGVELPPTGGCGAQLWTLYFGFNDYWIAYKRLVQAFLITVSEIVPTLNFGVFAGPTAAGNISNKQVITQPDGSKVETDLTGSYLLFDGADPAMAGQHIYETDIDQTLRNFDTLTLKTSSGELPIPGNLGYAIGERKSLSVLPHLPNSVITNASFVNTNPLSTTAYNTKGAIATAANTAYPGSIYLSPVDHPKKPFVLDDSVYGGPVPPGRGGVWEFESPLASGSWFHPAGFWHGLYSYFRGGDIWDSNPATRGFFPVGSGGGGMPMEIGKLFLDAGLSSNDGSWYWDPATKSQGMLDWPALRQINYTGPNAGSQTGGAYATERVRTVAGQVFNDLTGSYGGTDLRAVTKSFTDSCLDDIKQGNVEDKTPCVAVVITDGLPNLPCEESLLASSELDCDEIDFGKHMDLITQNLDKYFKAKNTYLVLLFMIGDNSLLTNPDYNFFKNKIKGYPSATFLELSKSTTTAEFQKKFEKALTVIKMLIIGFTKFI